jgi:hypothetical protein
MPLSTHSAPHDKQISVLAHQTHDNDVSISALFKESVSDCF